MVGELDLNLKKNVQVQEPLKTVNTEVVLTVL